MNDYSQAREALKETLKHQGSFDEERPIVRFTAVWLIRRAFDWPHTAPRADSSVDEGEGRAA